MDHQPSSTRWRQEGRRAGCRLAGPPVYRAIVWAVLCGLAPAEALAQRDAFIDAFVTFHSRLIGTYGDEGPQIVASLDDMAARLAAWEREADAAEAQLRTRGPGAPGDFALLYLDSGRREDALRALDAAIDAEPGRAALHRLRALVLEALDQPAEALAALTNAWEIDREDPMSAYLLADRRAAADGTADAAPQVAALLGAYDRAQAAGVDRPSAPFVELALVNDLAADTPIFSPALYADGFELMARGRYEAAIAGFRDAVARDPIANDPALRAAAMTRGTAALRAGRIPDALEPLEFVVAAHPASSEAHRILGAAHLASLDSRTAVERLRVAVEMEQFELAAELRDRLRSMEA